MAEKYKCQDCGGEFVAAHGFRECVGFLKLQIQDLQKKLQDLEDKGKTWICPEDYQAALRLYSDLLDWVRSQASSHHDIAVKYAQTDEDRLTTHNAMSHAYTAMAKEMEQRQQTAKQAAPVPACKCAWMDGMVRPYHDPACKNPLH